jgi:hypothetical protein
VTNAPASLHVLRLFVTPGEVRAMCRAHHLEPIVLQGSRPRFAWPLWRLLVTGRVGDDFAFTTTSSTALGYTGIARREAAPAVAGDGQGRRAITASEPRSWPAM